MNKIDEIALRVKSELSKRFNQAEEPTEEWAQVFAHALLAELSKDAEPVAFPELPPYIAKGNAGCYYDRIQMRQYAALYASLCSRRNSAPVIASEQKPVAWVCPKTSFTTISHNAMEQWTADGYEMWPLYTSPPNTADIEQRVAEACAKLLETHVGQTLADDVRSGKWREYL